MATSQAQARRQLDRRFDRLRPLLDEPRPHRGWVRAIRYAAGVSGPRATEAELEASEAQGTIGLGSLRRAAEALDCELVYFLVPRRSLQEAVEHQARRVAAEHLARIGHHSRLEDQALSDTDAAEELDALAADLVDRRGLWR